MQAAQEYAQAQRGWPWMIIGVFPTADDVLLGTDDVRRGFLYTVGLEPSYDLWMPISSVEDRMFEYEMAAAFLNGLAFGTLDATLRPGEDVNCEIGIPKQDGTWDYDADMVFWLGRFEINDGRRQTYRTDAPRILPVRWSSPLGWREET